MVGLDWVGLGWVGFFSSPSRSLSLSLSLSLFLKEEGECERLVQRCYSSMGLAEVAKRKIIKNERYNLLIIATDACDMIPPVPWTSARRFCSTQRHGSRHYRHLAKSCTV